MCRITGCHASCFECCFDVFRLAALQANCIESTKNQLGKVDSTMIRCLFKCICLQKNPLSGNTGSCFKSITCMQKKIIINLLHGFSISFISVYYLAIKNQQKPVQWQTWGVHVKPKGYTNRGRPSPNWYVEII